MILRRIARPLLASIFISGGINALRHSKAHAEMAAPLLDRVTGKCADNLPESVPTDPETLIRIDGAVKIAAGAALALGVLPRVSASVLLASLVPTTLAGHAYWEHEDPGDRQAHQIHLMKNAAIAGGLLLAVADTEGRPSLGWRTRRAVHATGKQVGGLGQEARGGLRVARRSSQRSAHKARKRLKH